MDEYRYIVINGEGELFGAHVITHKMRQLVRRGAHVIDTETSFSLDWQANDWESLPEFEQ